MGIRVPEHIVKNMKTQKLTTMFIPPDISYASPKLPTGFHYPPGCGYDDDYTTGFLVNIHHPQISPYYQAFKKCINKPSTIDDWERQLFEADMLLKVFRTEYKNSYIYSRWDVDKLTRTVLEHRSVYDRWLQFRTEMFGEQEAG